MNKKSQLRLLYSLIITSLFSIFLIYSFAGGDGSVGSPFEISNCTELQNMSSCLSCNYTLINDIDCSETINWNWNGSIYEGFMPIGDCNLNCRGGGDDYPFIGIMNGQNNEIQNLYINRALKDDVGLFGYVDYSIIENLNLINVEVNGLDSVGGLIGRKYQSTVENVYSSGLVSGRNTVGGLVGYTSFNSNLIKSSSDTKVIGGNTVGGLIGWNDGDGVITQSYSTGNVSGRNTVGGLVGLSYSGYIDNSYSTGSLDGNDTVGGLVGFNIHGDINNSYSTGSVDGNDTVGGLVGYMAFGSKVDNSYSTSNVNGNNNEGGLIGDYHAGTINNTIWLNTSSNINNTFGTGSTTGVTTTDILSYFYDCNNEPITFWNLTDKWICTGTDFPQLTWAYIQPQSSSSGIASIFPISNIFILFSIVIIIFIF